MVSKIQLKNYRSHTLTLMELAQFNLFLGPMGAGKSSVLHALSLLLCGQNPLVNAKSEGLRREIREGEEEFQIAAKLLNGMVIDQKVNGARNSIGVDGAYKDVRAQRGRISGALNCTEDVIQALLDPSPFFGRDEKSQRKTLLSLMSSKEIEAPKLVKKLGLAESFRSVGQVDETIKEVKDVKIRQLNREIDVLQKQIPDAYEIDAKLAAELPKKIATLRAQRDNAIRKQAASEEWGRTLQALEAEVKAAQAGESVAELEKRIEAAKQAKTDAEAAVTKLRDHYAKQLKGLNDGKAQYSATAANAGKTSDTLKVISTMGKKCGVIDVFECPLKDTDKKKMAGLLEGQIAEYKASNEAIKKAVDGLQKVVLEIEVQAGEHKKVIEKAGSDIVMLQRQVDHQREIYDRLAKHKASTPETGNWPKELADVSEKLAAAEISQKEVNDAQSVNSRRDLQVAEVRSKQTEAEELGAAVKELAELKDKLLSDGSSGFVQIMQGVLTPFGFKEVVYSSDPFGFFADGLLPDQMSGGQKILVEAALRLAAAKTSGLNIMALDDANKMGESARNKLAAILQKSGVQVIICSTTEAEPKAFTPPAGMKVYWFSNPSPTGPTTVREIRA